MLEAHIAQIEAVDEQLNSVVARRFDAARAEADAVDAARARGETLGPLAGVPITVKEQFHVEGMATTFGLPTRSDMLEGANGPLVTRLREAGAIIVGKTNVAELLFYQEGDNPLFGRTNNPWDLERTSGGGSGGEGAIIAAGGSPLGLAADIGGSIRTPAHFCGIQGLRPTSGRLTNLDSPPELFFPGMDAVVLDPGPMARTVADLELAMQVLAAPGLEKVDPKIPPVPWPDPHAVSIEGLRIGFFEDDGYWPASPALRRAVREAAEILTERGAIVEPFADPDPEAATRFYFSFLTRTGSAGRRSSSRAIPGTAGSKMLLRISWVPAWLTEPIAGLLVHGRAAPARERLPLVEEAVDRRSTGTLLEQRGEWRARFLAEMDAKQARRDHLPAAHRAGDAPRRDLLPLRHPELPDALQRARDAGGLGRGHARARRRGDGPAADPWIGSIARRARRRSAAPACPSASRSPPATGARTSCSR